MTDYISREAALFALRKAERGGSMTALTRLERAYAEIREMPAADVAEVVHGHRVDAGGFYARCSQCDGVLLLCANYCPNCGAKMDGAE